MNNYANNNKTKIGVITSVSPKDKKSSSGTIYTMCKSLEDKGFEIIWLPIKYTFLYKSIHYFLKIIRKIFNYTVYFEHTELGSKILSNSVDYSIDDKIDIYFAPFSSVSLKNFKSNKKLIYLSDATFAAMLGYYDSFSGLSKQSIIEGNKVEKNALNISDIIVLSSDWAKRSAIKDYGQNEDKVMVIEFGANIDEKDIIIKNKPSTDEINLLFLGVEWKRKGGDIAVEACKYINEQGIKCNLYIVGIKDLDYNIESLDFVKNIGFLNKNNTKEYNQLVEIILKCDCLILPTLAECSAIAFAESSAYGLPIFSHITGGVSNYVVDGINGYLLPIGSTGKDFGKKIIYCFENNEIRNMSFKARDFYKRTLNWNTWGDKMKELIEKNI